MKFGDLSKSLRRIIRFIFPGRYDLSIIKTLSIVCGTIWYLYSFPFFAIGNRYPNTTFEVAFVITLIIFPFHVYSFWTSKEPSISSLIIHQFKEVLNGTLFIAYWVILIIGTYKFLLPKLFSLLQQL